jgi:ATP-dependent protease ClpP protease subunit
MTTSSGFIREMKFTPGVQPYNAMTQPQTPSTHKFLRDRAILVGLPITDELAIDFEDALAQLRAMGDGPVTVFVNSPGGAALASERIMQLVEASGLEVRTCCVGLAAGSAAHIFALGRQRSAMADSVISFEDFRGGDSSDHLLIAGLRTACIDRTSRALGVSADTIAKWMREERSFSGGDLVHAKLAHSVL